MTTNRCLNCNQVLNSRFCPDCGQKSDTHRITFRHFVEHDLLHGVWHLERGMLFTIKQALIRPGKAALDYIKGKRVRYYNVFYLSLILIGLNALVIHFLRTYRSAASINSTDDTLFGFLAQHAKALVFAIVPVLAVNGSLIYRRLKLNFAEHLIVAGFCLTGIVLSSICWYIFDFSGEALGSSLIGFFELLFFLVLILFPVWTYWNLSATYYSRGGRIWRVLACYLLLIFEFICILMLITYLVTGDTTMYMII